MAISTPTGDVSTRLALDAGALAGLKQQAKTAPDKALKAAATQFEALFTQMLLKSMRAALPQDGMLSSDSSRTYTEMLDAQLAQHLGKRGIGIADVLVKQLSRGLARGAADGAAGAPVAGAFPARAPAGGIAVTPKPRFAFPPAAANASALPTAGFITTPAAANASMLPLTRSTATPGGAPTAIPTARRATVPAASALPAGPTGIAGGVSAFIEKLQPYAEAVGRAAGLPGAYLLAQAGLETGWGRFQPKGADGAPSHNIFGIKAGKSWTGPVVEAATTEYVDGKPMISKEKFRAYASYGEALQDFARLVSGNPRYAAAVARAGDAGAYAQGLQKAGYATDPRYAEKLVAAIRMVGRHTAVASAAAATTAQFSAGNADKPA